MRSAHRDWLPPRTVCAFLCEGPLLLALWLMAAGPLAAASTGETPAVLPDETPVALPGETPVAAPVAVPRAATSPSATLRGRLHVEGDAIEQVILGKVEAGGSVDAKNALVLRPPKLHVAIPAGQYVVMGIALQGGYLHIAPLQKADGKILVSRTAELLTIRPDKPCSLKVGLPLKPALLLVGRQGRTIQMVYALYDAQLRFYAEKMQEKPPQFTVSCNGREVGSGPLQYSRAATYGGSWRVPSTIFSGPLQIVASADLGAMGQRQSQPLLVPWHWYDQLSGFAGWALLGVLLLLVKENRNREALTILIPFVLLSEILWPWTAYLLAVLSVDTGQIGYPVQWLLVAWTALWLLSPWLARFRPALAIGWALALAAAVGAAAEFGFSQRFAFGPVLMNYAILILALLLAFVLSGFCCRRNYAPGRFLLWLVPWLILGVALGAMGELLRLYVSGYGRVPLAAIMELLPPLVVSSLCFAGALYLLALPYLYVAFHSALYGERFHELLRLPEYVPPARTAPEAGEGAESPAE